MEKVFESIADLQFGLYEKPVESGDTIYLQVKDFDANNQFSNQPSTFLNSDEKSIKHLLTDGDVIFVAKGFRNFAWTYKESFGPAIASSIFFVIKVDTSEILPEYLTTLFNSNAYQQVFQQLGAGSSIPSIRKSELEAIKIHVPSLELQRKAVMINELYLKELELTTQIMDEKQKYYSTIINKLITQEHV
jgi:restriction endonuclease S subunit